MPPEQPLAPWYQRPLKEWLEALHVGNGRLGGMVYDGVPSERIQLNDDTLWSVGPKEGNNPKAHKTLPEIRRPIFEGKFAEAHQLGKKKKMGPYTQTYLPIGDLVLVFAAPGALVPAAVHDYCRTLDLDRGVASVRYAIGDVVYTRELFVSHPDQAMVVRLTASRPRSLAFTAQMASRLHFCTLAADEALVLKRKIPTHVDPSYYDRPNPIVYAPDDEHGEGMLFQCRLRAIVDEGKTLLNGESLRVERASTVTLLLSAVTSFNGFDRSPGRDGKDPGRSPQGSSPPLPGGRMKISWSIISPTISVCTGALRLT